MKQIVMALRAYQQVHGTFPPPYIADKDGKPMHSWRVLILPFIEEKALYDQYSFDEPWDGPNNRKLWDKTPYLFQCPTCRLAAIHGTLKFPTTATSYLALVGSESIWTGPDPYKDPHSSRARSNAFVLMESTEGICWMEPRDASLNYALEQLNSTSGECHILLNHGFFVLKAYRSRGQFANLNMSVQHDVSEILQTMSEAGQLADGEAELRTAEGLVRETSNEISDATTIVKWKVVCSFSTFVLLTCLPVWKLLKGRGSRCDATRSDA